jgi:hypothetical protein
MYFDVESPILSRYVMPCFTNELLDRGRRSSVCNVESRITRDAAQSDKWPDRRESDLGHSGSATTHITYDVGTYKPGPRNLLTARLRIEEHADVERESHGRTLSAHGKLY